MDKFSFDVINFNDYKYSPKDAGAIIKIKKDQTFEIISHAPDVENQRKKRWDWEYIAKKQTFKALHDVEIRICKDFILFDRDLVVGKKERSFMGGR